MRKSRFDEKGILVASGLFSQIFWNTGLAKDSACECLKFTFECLVQMTSRTFLSIQSAFEKLLLKNLKHCKTQWISIHSLYGENNLAESPSESVTWTCPKLFHEA